MRTVNVAIFTDNDFEKVNGVTTVLRAVLEHRSIGVHPRVYTCDSIGISRPDYFSARARGVGIPYYSEMKMYVPPARRLRGEAIADGASVVHVATPGPVGLCGVWVARALGIPLIGSFHTHLVEYTTRLSGSQRLGALMQYYLRWFYGECEQVLVPSASTRDVLVAMGIDEPKIRIWERGVSTARFAPSRRSAQLRESWRAWGRTPVLLYAGRLSREKGLSDVPAIQSGLRRAGIEHRIVFVGDGPMRAELERLCPDAAFTGSLPHDAVAVAMASADVFLFPSRTDTAGNVVLEAQASGLPVLVSDEGGPRENLRAGESGEICADVATFVGHAARLCLDGPLRARQSAGARAFAETRSWGRALEPLFQAYRDAGTHMAAVPAVASKSARSTLVSRAN